MDTASERDDGDAVPFATEPEVEEMTRLRVDNECASTSDGAQQLEQQRVLMLERERTQSQDVAGLEADRHTKRQRLQIDSIAPSQSNPLQKEIETLQTQIKRNSELHQIELKERDVQLAQLRRQLKYAAVEEEETRNELKAAVSEHSSEQLQSQKKIVELDSKLRFVESSLNEWKERALESESQLRTATRQSKLKVRRVLSIQLLEDQLEVANAAKATVSANSVSGFKLAERDFTLQSVNSNLARGLSVTENTRDVSVLNEKIKRLETAERALKAELVDLIESSKHASALEERLYQAEKQLQASKERNAEALKQIESYKALENALRQSQAIQTDPRSLVETSAQPVNEVAKQEMETSRKLMAAPTTLNKYELKIVRLERELAEAKRQNGNLTKHLEKVEMELAVLEKRLGKGEFNAETTKIVHLAVNPTSEMLKSKGKTSEVETLRQENEVLRSKLERLSGGCDVEMTPAAAAAVPSTFTTTTSYETVEGQKLLNKRLKEVFREQIQHYREAVHLLTGYKIDLRKSNGMELLRLRSVYGDHDEDELLVRMEADGALELLESDFCAHVPQRVLAYLTTCRSFPAFLATLTLHLFEKQTFQGN